MLLYFVWTFPNTFKISKLKWLKIIFTSIVFLVMAAGLILVQNFEVAEKFNLNSINAFLTFIRIFAIAANITAFISLIIQYRKESKKKTKPIMIFILAFLFGFLVQFYVSTIAPAISDTVFNSPEYYTPILLLILVPLMFAYAIFKYHFLDVSVVIKNTITYGIATASVAGIYFLVVYLMGQGISRAIGSENQGIIAGVFS